MTDSAIVLLTDEFPYGLENETYLESELPILAERFPKIYLLPSQVVPGVRPIPANVELVHMPWLTLAPTRERLATLGSAECTRVILDSFRTWRDLLAYLPAANLYADILSRNILRARQLRQFTRDRGLFDAIFYDYWLENGTLGLALYRRTNEISRAVARAHRFDIFDEAWDGRPVPFQQAKAKGLDMVYPTSRAGADYLRAHVPGLKSKLEVHRLGAVDPGQASPPQAPGEPPLILTCARLTSVKRIDRVPGVLARMGQAVRWVHLGDGPERPAVEAAARAVLQPGSWELRGRIPNHDALEFYRSNSVQVLLSLASSEGLPVSMMEAQSFGVPIVSCDVGGISEIVNEHTGVLVDRAASDAAIADALTCCLADKRLTRDAIRAQYRRRYDATANYEAFAQTLKELEAHGSPSRDILRTRAR